MKRSLLIAALVACTAMMAKAQSAPTAVDSNSLNIPIITFETEVIDFGTIPYGSDGNREFKFRNTGKEPLLIQDVVKGCGCTLLTPTSKDPIKPGGSGTIKFNYDTKRVGNFDKTINVISNASVPNKTLHFKGSVLPQKQ